MLVVNLFGAPSAGKSAIACGLFEKLKIYGLRCEISMEYAKRLIRDGREKELLNQSYVTNKQYHKLFMMKQAGDVDVVVTDAPLPMGLAYAGDRYARWYSDMVWDFYHENDNVNYFLNRGAGEYKTDGRQQDEEEAVRVGLKIKDILAFNDLTWTDFDRVPESSQKILEHLIGTGELDKYMKG
jgi:hypothetical protein